MLYAGTVGVTTIDYPGKVATVVYTKGCCCRCPYCHNKIINEDQRLINTKTEKDIVDEIKKNSRILEGVVLSGGEPLLHVESLVSLISKLKNLNLCFKLDTCALPIKFKNIEHLLCNIDMVAVDIKAPLYKYKQYIKGSENLEKYLNNLQDNLKYISEHIPEYELRSTVHFSLHTEQDLFNMKNLIESCGLSIDRWYLQQYHEADCYDISLNNQESYTKEDLTKLAEKIGCKVRNN